MTRQLALDLPVTEACGREDFLVAASNAAAVAALDDWRTWPAGKLVLIGPDGSGKTHLARIWAAAAGAAVLPAQALPAADLPALAATGAVAVEDADRLPPDGSAERPLLHLHNLLAQTGGSLLVTARTPPRDWPVALPDLASRMQATVSVRLEPPDDALLAAVLVKQFADRQITVAPEVISHAVARMERSLAAARRLAADLDALALAEGRAVTRGLVTRLLTESDRDSTDKPLDGAPQPKA